MYIKDTYVQNGNEHKTFKEYQFIKNKKHNCQNYDQRISYLAQIS